MNIYFFLYTDRLVSGKSGEEVMFTKMDQEAEMDIKVWTSQSLSQPNPLFLDSEMRIPVKPD